MFIKYAWTTLNIFEDERFEESRATSATVFSFEQSVLLVYKGYWLSDLWTDFWRTHDTRSMFFLQA